MLRSTRFTGPRRLGRSTLKFREPVVKKVELPKPSPVAPPPPELVQEIQAGNVWLVAGVVCLVVAGVCYLVSGHLSCLFRE